MRPNRLVVGSVLTAALALVALPGLAGSRAPSPLEQVPAGAFQPLSIRAEDPRSTTSIGTLDVAHLSDGSIDPQTPILEPVDGRVSAVVVARSGTSQPRSAAGKIRKPAKYTLTGDATFYDNGTTAMRLPRGTRVIICGDGGCIERVVTDYGPIKKSRVVDLYRPDFFRICGCGWWSGVTKVTVYVY